MCIMTKPLDTDWLKYVCVNHFNHYSLLKQAYTLDLGKVIVFILFNW